MKEKKEKSTVSTLRREFLSNTVKLALLGSFITPLTKACTNNKSKSGGEVQPDSTHKGKRSSGSKRKRQKWSHESLVVNSKTGVMHFPTSKVYHYYDEIKSGHIKDVAIGAWATALQEKVRFNKDQSGNIVEILTLHELKGDLDDTTFVIAIDTLSTAFEPAYENSNSKNFRLHELMLQLVALNNAIPADQKWMTFNAKIKKPEQLRKRQAWMANETAFNERVKYISDHQNDYKHRLNERAKKYSFT